MRQMISGLVAAAAVMTVSAAPASACGGLGLFSSCSPCGGSLFTSSCGGYGGGYGYGGYSTAYTAGVAGYVARTAGVDFKLNVISTIGYHIS